MTGESHPPEALPFPSRKAQLTEHSRIYAECALVGVLSGLVAVAYRLVIGMIEEARETSLTHLGGSPGKIALWFALVFGACGATILMIRRMPIIKGSGIPQVKALLMERIKFDWMRELPGKFFGGALAIGAGLSLGREGPSIQLGALIGTAVDETLGGDNDHGRFLVTAGAAAGISAAFNAPLAGVLFCIEELHRQFSPTMLTATLLASFLSNAVMWLLCGADPVFSIAITRTLPLSSYAGTVIPIGIIAGIIGSLFNTGITGTQKFFARTVHSDAGRLAIAFAIAGAVSLIFAPITGGGNLLVHRVVVPGDSLRVLALMLAAKLTFTLFSYASGAPGGIFMPMLALGALVGAMAHVMLRRFGFADEYLANCILLGMAGFFVAVVRAPVTGAVLITEMAGSLGHFPAFILVSLVAATIAGLMGTRPIYDILLEQTLARYGTPGLAHHTARTK